MSDSENGSRPVALIDRDWEEQHMSPIENSDSAAWRELEAVRAEVAALRRQLADSPDQARELEARIDSLTIRNAKLMDTLKEARQQDRKSTRLNSSHVKSPYAVF